MSTKIKQELFRAIHSFDKAAGMFALGKVAPGRLDPVLFVLWKSNTLERLSQGIFVLLEWNVEPLESLPQECRA